jgi:hypothetical protein
MPYPTRGGLLVELTVPLQSLGAGIGERVRVSCDLARYLCANGHAVIVRESVRDGVAPHCADLGLGRAVVLRPRSAGGRSGKRARRARRDRRGYGATIAVPPKQP